MPVPFITVIVPVYNVESYIRCCLDSLRAQTFQNFEVILIDDGSIDHSGDICDEYATVDKRFKVIRQKNGGVSVARQVGLNLAKGDYIIHVDPDDWVLPNMLSELYEKAEDTGVDMVVCDIWMHGSYCSQKFYPETAENLQRLLILGGRIHPSCCNKLISRKCINNYRITFTPDYLNYMEDMLFHVRLLQHKIKVCYLQKAFYHYRYISSSLSKTLSDKKLKSTMYIIEEFERMNLIDIHTNYACDQKKDALYMMWQLGYFSKLENTYSEVHHLIKKAGEKYHPFFPRMYFLAMALNGKPGIAFYIYGFNMWLIEMKERVQKYLTARKNN